MTILTTARLRLEPICDDHYEAMRALNSQEEVMRYITGKPETAEETRAAIERIRKRWEQFGFGWWAVFEQASGRFIGMVALQHLAGDGSQPHELGWRLDPTAWGKGYATEAMQEVVRHAWDTIGAPMLVAVAEPANEASQNVMRRLGMRYRGLEQHYGRELALWEMARPA